MSALQPSLSSAAAAFAVPPPSLPPLLRPRRLAARSNRGCGLQPSYPSALSMPPPTQDAPYSSLSRLSRHPPPSQLGMVAPGIVPDSLGDSFAHLALADPHASLSAAAHAAQSVWGSALHLADAAVGTIDGAVQQATAAAGPILTEGIGQEGAMTYADLTPEMEEMSLGALGHDLVLFLAASVVVEPLGKLFNLTPVLLYLILGFVAGPHGLSVFAGGPEVNAEIGDFGILFLLFVEGLNLSPERLKALGSFFSLGATQLLLSVGVIFFGFFLGGPYLLPLVQDVRVPIDDQVFSLLESPVIAFSIAAAGALSSSAFVLPILKEKGWEKNADGIAALSILLLQDLAVAPLLVILPLIAEYETGSAAGGGGMMQDTSALTLVVAKATLGFGGVLAVASQVLRQIFQFVASYGSSQTFVAASLLVACGMGIIADNLGLSATTGAFAAGVLLAESGYRAQIEADIKPFEGILLGVFFTTAGAELDPQTVVEQWPTLLAGIAAFIVVKIGIVFSAGEFALGLTRAQSARVALLLAGGGEFAFVVFKVAEDLGILSADLTKLLTASVIISMSLTPLLGELAAFVGGKFEEIEEMATVEGDLGEDYDINLTDESMILEAFEMFDEDGSGSISAEELQGILTKPGTVNEPLTLEEVRAVISRFDDNGDEELQYDEFAALWTAKRRGVIAELGRGDAAAKDGDGEGQRDVSRAIVVCGYGEVGQRLCASLEGTKRSTNGGLAYVAFSRNPSRISQGVLNGATVVYGDGASAALVKAAGVEDPAAIAVTYVSESKCLEATKRLRNAYPSVPIYVRADRQARVKTLLEAGATDVIVEKDRVADTLGNMLGVRGVITANMLQDAVPSLLEEEEDARLLPYTDTELTELANQCGKTREEMVELFKLFATSFGRNERGEVQLSELRNELMRQSDTPLDDKALADWMGYDEALSKWVTGDAEKQWVSFSDFVRFTADKQDAAFER